ncbi:MAG: PDGLE domain-containing protein [Dehalococcoidia bacterium]
MTQTSHRKLILTGIVLAIVIAAASAFLASGSPDGLERVAEDHGFIERAQGAWYSALPDYTVPGLGDGAASTIAAGAVGVLAVTAVSIGAGALIRRRSRNL